MFPLNLGIRAHDLEVRNREEIVQKVSQLHLSHIQFAPQKAFPEQLKLNAMTLVSAAYFGEYFQKNNIELSILGCYINLSSKNQEVRAQALATFKQQIALCSA